MSAWRGSGGGGGGVIYIPLLVFLTDSSSGFRTFPLHLSRESRKTKLLHMFNRSKRKALLDEDLLPVEVNIA